MIDRLKILHLEDDPVIRNLVRAVLQGSGLAFDLVGVASMEEYERAIEAGPWDAILSDYDIQGAPGPRAFDLARAKDPEVPFIYVTGSLGEEAAVECLQRGATDCIFKDRLARLGEAVRRAVAEVQERRARRQAESESRDAGALARQMIASASVGIVVLDRSLRYMAWNPVMEEMSGLKAGNVLGKTPMHVFPFIREQGFDALLARALEGESSQVPDFLVPAQAGSRSAWISTRIGPLRDGQGLVVGVTVMILDVTARKKAEEALRESERRLAEALRRTEDRVVQLEEQVRDRAGLDRLAGKSALMQEVYRKIRLAAQSDVTVLLAGESGTGKELAAAAIHALGDRKGRPFVAVNCAAIPETLLESELFGHVKGAFTGAVRDKAGLFESAQGGTLFLDEVGDMPPSLQAKVLRALQEREIRRVGDARPVRVDARLIAASNKDLRALVAQKKMREDFYYRVHVFSIGMPPLRERRDDIPLLASRFVEELSKAAGKKVEGISAGALRRLMEHPWPGNVRELRNALEHAIVTVSGREINLEDLPPEVREPPPADAVPSPGREGDRRRILEALDASGGNRAEAAKKLGISRVTLWKRLSRLGIDPATGTPPPPRK